MTIAPSDKRVFARRRVRRSAECVLGGSKLAGHIRDESDGGVFFALPATDARSSSTLEYDPELGDTVVLVYPEEATPVSTLAVIRWRGFSREHGCEGLGLMFDRD